jgi:hypothetical protein
LKTCYGNPGGADATADAVLETSAAMAAADNLSLARLKSLTARSTLPLDRDPRGTTETLCPDRPIGHVAVMLDFADLAGHLRPVSVR